ncbi:hypothetical protein JNUCC1_03164 [Lentibacillus sp. JNUCC-1]|nr:hypothetical protein [Lentibacillus sp. JNUCC-1]
MTPIGIGISAKSNPIHYVSVTVNGEQIRLFEMASLSVGDCLVHAGLDIQAFYGRPGLAKIVILNGKEITLPGEFGEQPTLYLNSKIATVDTSVTHGDHIIIERGNNGASSVVTIDDLIEEAPMSTIIYNNERYHIKPIYYVNGNRVTEDYLIQDKDKIDMHFIDTIRTFLIECTTEKLGETQHDFIYVNQEPYLMHAGSTQVLLNGKVTDINAPLQPGDSLKLNRTATPTLEKVLTDLGYPIKEEITVEFNQETLNLSKAHIKAMRNDRSLEMTSSLHPGDEIEVTEKQSEGFIFQDVFNYVELDLTNKQGHFILYKNDAPAGFTDPIDHGDQLAIVWKQL